MFKSIVELCLDQIETMFDCIHFSLIIIYVHKFT